MNGYDLRCLSSAQFEEFCADLLRVNGFVNIDWRKGTGLSTSPADKGRDIVCDHLRVEPDGSQHFEKWFVDCKHFRKGIPPKEIRNLLAWAEAERPDVALIAASNFLSNPAKEYLDAYRRNNRSGLQDTTLGETRARSDASGQGKSAKKVQPDEHSN